MWFNIEDIFMRYFYQHPQLWTVIACELGGLEFPNSFTITDKIMQCNLIRISFRITVVSKPGA